MMDEEHRIKPENLTQSNEFDIDDAGESSNETEEMIYQNQIKEINNMVDKICDDAKFLWENTISSYNHEILLQFDEISSSKFLEFILENSPAIKKLLEIRSLIIKDHQKYLKDAEETYTTKSGVAKS